MFDFLKDTYLEMHGLDLEKAKLEKVSRQEGKAEEKRLIPKSVRIVIVLFSFFYLLSCLGSVPIMVKSQNIILMARSVIQIIIIVAILVLMFIKNKKSEIAVIGLTATFIVLQYSGLFLIK